MCWIWPWWSASRHPFLPGRIGGDGARKVLEAQAKVLKTRISLVNKSQVYALSIGCGLPEKSQSFPKPAKQIKRHFNKISVCLHSWDFSNRVSMSCNCIPGIQFFRRSIHAFRNKPMSWKGLNTLFMKTFWTSKVFKTTKQRSRKIIAAPSTTASTRRIHKGCGTRGIRDLRDCQEWSLSWMFFEVTVKKYYFMQ